MTEEIPVRSRDDYEPYKPSEEYGLVKEFDDSHDPEYLLEPSEEEFSIQLDFGYFFNQTEIYDWQ